MASIHLGSFNAYNSSYGAYNVYFQYDGTTRNGTTINVINARVYYERIGTGYTTNRIATSGNVGNGQNSWYNVTLNPSGTQSPASMTHTLGTLTVTGVDYTTDVISVNVQAKGTGASSTWTSTSGSVQLNNTFNISVPVINISTVTATNANIGSASSININRYSSAFTHALYYKFVGQSTWTLIASGVATSYGWTVPTSAYALIPNAKTINCEILCETYNGASYIGANSTSMTASVDEVANAPDVSAVITDVNSLTVGLTGNNNNIVKFISNARTQITATPKNSATISSYKVTCGDGKTASTQDSTLNAVESGSFTVEATDSRGIKKTVVYNKTLIVYTKLTLNPTFYRTQPTNNEIALTYNGNYFNNTFGNTANTLSLKYRYREVGGTWSSYINLTPTKSGNTYSNGASPTILGTSFDYTKAYQFEIIANDQIYTGSEIMNSPTVARGIPIYWWNKLGMYIEEKLYAKKGVEVTGNITSTGTIESTGKMKQETYSILDTRDISNILNGTSTIKALSEAQGKALYDYLKLRSQQPLGEFTIWQGNFLKTGNDTWSNLGVFYGMKEAILYRYPLKTGYTRKVKIVLDETDNKSSGGIYVRLTNTPFSGSFTREYIFGVTWGSTTDGVRNHKYLDFNFDELPNGHMQIDITPDFATDGTIRIYRVYFIIYDEII